MAEAKLAKPPSTRSQSSRKSKKAWRKNIDLDIVQSGLEDLQTAKIAHGNVLPSEQQSSELFATDIDGDQHLADKQQAGRKLLKAEEILAIRSAIPGLVGRKRKAEEKIVTSNKKARNGTYVPHKQLQKLREVADGKEMDILADDSAAHDPWAESVAKVNTRLDFVEEAVKPRSAHEPNTLKHASHALTANGKLTPHVRIPDAGKSYNPLVGDWSALIQREGEAAVDAEKRRLKVEAAAAQRDAKAAEEAAKVEATEKDLYATDYDSAWESEWDGFLSGAEDEVHTQKQKARKTQVERNKIKARKQRDAAEIHERKLKEREKDTRRVKEIAREVSEKDKAKHARARAVQSPHSSDSEDSGDEVQLRRHRLGKVAVPDAPLEVVLPEELEDSLRRLKPEGDLIQERYRNLLVNGKLEVRKKAWQHKQPDRTRSEKWSYKDWKLR